MTCRMSQLSTPNGTHSMSSCRMEHFRRMRLRDLAHLVAAEADAEALAEIHTRPLFLVDHTRMTIAGFLNHLRHTATREGYTDADLAYDMTVDRFSCLGPEGLPDDSLHSPPEEAMCHKYYRVYVAYIDKRLGRADESELEQDHLEARAFQTLVRRHFYFSLNECSRSGFMTRYVWRLPGGHLQLRMPRSIAGVKRAAWLEENIPDVDPERPGEKVRIQQIIDQKVGQRTLLPLDERQHVDIDSYLGSAPVIPGQDLMRVSTDGLASTVAKEKAANLSSQRKAISKLGKKRLEALVVRLFNEIATGDLNLTKVATDFGISKATLSRFAGVNWDRNGNGSGMPDLWKNTAQVLGSDPDFRRAAKSAGEWNEAIDVPLLRTHLTM